MNVKAPPSGEADAGQDTAQNAVQDAGQTATGRRPLAARLRLLLGYRHLPWLLAAVSVALCLPSLELGFMLDDHFHRVMLQGHEMFDESRPPTDLFAFGDASESPPSTVPWWVSDGLRFHFFRPLTSLSHALDHALWPAAPALMHAQSLFWLGLTVLATALLYRRLLPRASIAVAGLAALLFAVDDAHAAPAMWLANRSALIALFFGVLALLAHHQRRRHGWRAGAVAAPAALALAMLAGESGMTAGAYLLAYALFLDRGSMRERLVALWPPAAVGAVWATIYKVGDYGTSSSGLYADPTGEPLRFVSAVIERAPILLFGQFALPPSDLYLYLSQPAARTAELIALLLVAVMAWLFWPLVKSDAAARFAASGAALSILPLCATLPSNRLLAPVSLGDSLLLATLLARAWAKGDPGAAGLGKTRRLVARALTPLFLLAHLVAAPLFLLTATSSFERMERYFTGPASTLPQNPAEHVLLVNAPNAYLAALAPSSQAAKGRPLPAEMLLLATSVYSIEYERLDARTLRVRPQGGFLLPPGTAPEGRQPPPLDFRNFLQTADQLYWDGDPFEAGQEISRNRVLVRIVSTTPDGRPAEVDFLFDAPLEEFHWIRFVEWQDFAPWQPPGLGETSLVEALGPGA